MIRLDVTPTGKGPSSRWVSIVNPSNKIIIHYGADSLGAETDTAQAAGTMALLDLDKTPSAQAQLTAMDEMQTVPRNSEPEPRHWTITPGTPGSKARSSDPATPGLQTHHTHHTRRQPLDSEPSFTSHSIQYGDSQAELARLQAELEEQAAAVSKADATIAALRHENSNLRSQLHNQASKHRRQLLDSCAVAKQSVEAQQHLWTELQKHEAEASQARVEMDGLRKKNAGLKSQLKQLVEFAEWQESYKKMLEEEVKRLSDQLQGTQERASYTAVLEEQVKKLKSRLQDKPKRLAARKVQASEVQLERAEAVAEVQRLRFQLEEHAGAASAARLEAEGLRRNVADLEGQVASQRQQLMEAIDLARQERSYSRELEGEVAQVKERLQDKALAASQARAEAEGLRRQVAELGGQAEEQRRQLGEGSADQQVVMEDARALPRQVPVHCALSRDSQASSTMTFDDRGTGGGTNPKVKVLCRCEGCTRGAWVSPTRWMEHQGLAGRSWSDEIKVDLARFPELRLGDGKSVCSVGKFLNLHGYEWKRSPRSTYGTCPVLIPAFRRVGVHAAPKGHNPELGAMDGGEGGDGGGDGRTSEEREGEDDE